MERSDLVGESVKVCKCNSCAPHKFQDELYGKFVRVHNISQTGTNKDKQKCCTVCGIKTDI